MVYKQRLNLKETSLKKPSNIYGKYQESQVNINGIITTLIYNSLIGKHTTVPKNYKLIKITSYVYTTRSNRITFFS